MRDPYLYEDVPVLRNKLHIREQDLLDDAEADYVVFRLKDIVLNPLRGDYHTPHLLQMAMIFTRKNIWKESCMMHSVK